MFFFVDENLVLELFEVVRDIFQVRVCVINVLDVLEVRFNLLYLELELVDLLFESGLVCLVLFDDLLLFELEIPDLELELVDLFLEVVYFLVSLVDGVEDDAFDIGAELLVGLLVEVDQKLEKPAEDKAVLR